MTLERTLGLPPLRETLASLTKLATGERGERLERVTAMLKELGQDARGLAQALEVLRLLEKLDRDGALVRLDRLLKDLKPLVESPILPELMRNLQEMAPLLQQLGNLEAGPEKEKG